jgi:hypothetical protein
MSVYSIGQSVIVNNGVSQFIAKLTGLISTNTTTGYYASRYYLVRGSLVEMTMSWIPSTLIVGPSGIKAEECAVKMVTSY